MSGSSSDLCSERDSWPAQVATSTSSSTFSRLSRTKLVTLKSLPDPKLAPELTSRERVLQAQEACKRAFQEQAQQVLALHAAKSSSTEDSYYKKSARQRKNAPANEDSSIDIDEDEARDYAQPFRKRKRVFKPAANFSKYATSSSPEDDLKELEPVKKKVRLESNDLAIVTNVLLCRFMGVPGK